MAGAIALGLARWLEKLCCVLRCAFIVASVVTRSMHSTVFIFCTVLHDVYIYLLRSTRSFPGLAMTLAWAGGIFIRYCKEDTCYTLVDLYCTFDSYIVYCGSSKKVLTALLTLADCVGSLNNSICRQVTTYPKLTSKNVDICQKNKQCIYQDASFRNIQRPQNLKIMTSPFSNIYKTPRHCLVPLRQLIFEVTKACLCGSQFLRQPCHLWFFPRRLDSGKHESNKEMAVRDFKWEYLMLAL